MARGRPRKKQKSASGLRSQELESLAPEADVPSAEKDIDDDSGTNQDIETCGLESAHEHRSDFDIDKPGSEKDEEAGLGDEEFGRRLAEMMDKEDNRDCDWIPKRLLRQRERRMEERRCEPLMPLTKGYMTGPDVMSKSKRTQTRYRKHWRNQTRLDVFGFGRDKVAGSGQRVVPAETTVMSAIDGQSMDEDHKGACSTTSARLSPCGSSIPRMRRASGLSIESSAGGSVNEDRTGQSVD
ncbi:hypothetical protein ID866_11627 [Astraeus odoratus]|nr:hypothetical protein ID866_11627 [Astraeus odoratus]